MICPGIVTNVTNFGAFVDVGVHQDGLVHISEISHKFVDDPRKVVNPGDHVTVKVLKVDTAKNQISFTMKLEEAPVSMSKDKMNYTNKERGGQFNKDRSSFNKENKSFSRDSGSSPKGSRKDFGSKGPFDSKNAPKSGDRSQNAGNHKKPAGSPFNNPFAALMGNTEKK